MVRPTECHSPELSIAHTPSLGDVKLDTTTQVATFEPRQYCWLAEVGNMCVTASDASPQAKGSTNLAVVRPGFPHWVGALYGTVPDAEVVGASLPITHAHPTMHHHHFVDAAIIIFHISLWCVMRLIPGAEVHGRCAIVGRALFLNPTGGGSNPEEDRDPPNDPRPWRLLFSTFGFNDHIFQVTHELYGTSIPKSARGTAPPCAPSSRLVVDLGGNGAGHPMNSCCFWYTDRAWPPAVGFSIVRWWSVFWFFYHIGSVAYWNCRGTSSRRA